MLSAGTRLGPYEITGTLGVGGMGEVYRAHDARLGRDVALKVLPELFAADPERLARFQREAQVLAALKHPNIGAIYGLEEGPAQAGPHVPNVGVGSPNVGAGFSRPIQALVLELVEGDTLADRIARGLIPVDEALPIAKQIAEALEAAHEQGVIHRDLKPSNIKITPDGHVKVLDFGLAKLTDVGRVPRSGPAGADDHDPDYALSMSPTITSPAMMTGVGVLLGTSAYMAPEQAKGRPADKRSDVWAFGCVLFEMLAGKRAFEADDISDTLALVLKGEPDWKALAADVPPSIRALNRSCLEKDRRQRLADISGALFVFAHQLDLAPAIATPQPRTSWWRWAAVSSVCGLMIAIVAIGVWLLTKPTAQPVSRFFVMPPDGTAFVTGGRAGTSAAISPDGRTIAFTARNAAGKVTLWLRQVNALTAQPVAGTDDAQFPFWSPDSRFIAFFTADKLQKIAASGGPAQTLCTVDGGRGGTWGRTGQIIYSTLMGPLFRVPSSGGSSSPVTRLATDQINHRFPSYLPDGQHVLYYAQGLGDAAGLYVISLDSEQTQRLAQTDSGAVYDSRDGYLLFVRQGTLLAQAFDPNGITLKEEPFPVAEQVESGIFTGVVSFSVSNDGALTYGIGSSTTTDVTVVLVDREGKAIQTIGALGTYLGIDLSPDGKRVVTHRHEGLGGDIWVTDMSRAATSRITFDATQDYASPIWSPDGTRVAFGSSSRTRGLFTKSSNGAGDQEKLLESADDVEPESWTPDGKALVYRKNDPRTRGDLWMLPLSGDRKPVPLVTTPFDEANAQVSPDGKWLAYQSNETGEGQIYVRPFPTGSGKWQMSTSGGFAPRWRGDGRELFYLDPQYKLFAVSVQFNSSAVEAGVPKPLFDSGYVTLNSHGAQPHHAYAVSADGQRFLIPRPATNRAPDSSAPIAVVLNWAQGISH